MEPIWKAYEDTVNYAQYLETLLKMYAGVDDEALGIMRKQYLKPVTNVAKDWIGE